MVGVTAARTFTMPMPAVSKATIRTLTVSTENRLESKPVRTASPSR